MNSRECELLYIKFTRNYKTLRFAQGIPWIPQSLNSFLLNLQEGPNFAFRFRDSMSSIICCYFILNLKGSTQFGFRLRHFGNPVEFQTIPYQLDKEGFNFAFSFFMNSMNPIESALFYIKFTKKDQSLCSV